MVPIIFINCDGAPYVKKIMLLQKLFETRSKDMLRPLAGRRVFVAETHKGRRPVVRCSLRIGPGFMVDNSAAYEQFRQYTCVPCSDVYNWQPTTKRKWLYPLLSVAPVRPFIPAEGKRHGVTWMEYNGKEVIL